MELGRGEAYFVFFGAYIFIVGEMIMFAIPEIYEYASLWLLRCFL